MILTTGKEAMVKFSLGKLCLDSKWRFLVFEGLEQG